MKKRKPKRLTTLTTLKDSMKKCCTAYFVETSVRLPNPNNKVVVSIYQQLATDEIERRRNISPSLVQLRKPVLSRLNAINASTLT